MRRANYTDTADTGDDYLCSLCYVVDPDGVIYVTDAVYSREPMEMTEDWWERCSASRVRVRH